MISVPVRRSETIERLRKELELREDVAGIACCNDDGDEGVASCEFISGVFLRRKASSGRAGEEEEERQSLEQGQRKGKR